MVQNNINIYAGLFMKRSRKERNMTGKELANLMHVSQQQISRYETGITSLTLEQLNQILGFLGKSWEDLVNVIKEESKVENKVENDESKNLTESDKYQSLSFYLVNNIFRR